MANLADVSEGLAERLRPVLPEFAVLWFQPENIPTPAVVIAPDYDQFIDYEQTNGPYAVYKMLLTLILGAVDEESSRREMADLLSPTGPVISALCSEDIDDNLTRVAGQYVMPMKGQRYTVINRNGNRYLYAEISVLVGAN